MTQPSNAVTKRPIDELRGMLEKMAPRMADVLPRHITPERMLRLALLTYNRQPDLAKCSISSIVEAVMTISAWGLEIGRTAHLVPFGGKATAIADYKGKIELAVKGGTVRSVDARCVYEHDDFYYEYGLNERLVHRPAMKRGKIIGAYAIARLVTGGNKFEFMPLEELERIRQGSKMATGPAWKNHTGEMYKKTVTHRVLKTVPWSNELAEAYQNEQALDDDPDGEALPVGGTGARVAAGGVGGALARGDDGYGDEPAGEVIPDDDPEPASPTIDEIDREIAQQDRPRSRP